MKKPLKITLISLGSLIGLILIVLVVVFDIVLNSKRTTALVNKYASKFITCEYNIGKVDITFFKTFPDVGVEIDDLVLVNKMQDCPNDTLAAIKECVVALNIKELVSNKNIIVNKANLYGGCVNAFFNEKGENNFDIFVSGDEEEKEEEKEPVSYSIDLDKLKLKDVNLSYTDLSSNTNAAVNGMDMTLKVKVDEEAYLGDLYLKINDIDANIADDSTSINSVMEDFKLESGLKYVGDIVECSPKISLGKTDFLMSGNDMISADFDCFAIETQCVMRDFNLLDCSGTGIRIDSVSLSLGEDEYLNDVNVTIDSRSPLRMALKEKDITIGDLSLAVNDLIIGLAGHLAMNEDGIDMNVDVKTNTLEVAKTIDFVPDAVLGDALDGIYADGKLKLNANVAGVYNENSMPVVTADIAFNDGFFEMPEALPFPVRAINTDINAKLDLNGETDITLNSLKAKMNNSSVDVKGKVNDALNESRRCDIRVKADVKTADVKPFIPDDIKVKGTINADVYMKGSVAEVTNMNLSNSQFDVKLALKDLIVNYCDTINLVSNNFNVNVAYPRRVPNENVKKFAQLKVNGTDLVANVSEMMSVNLDDFDISGFVSDIVGGSKQPSVTGEFGFSHLVFNMDDINVDADNTNGAVTMLEQADGGDVSYTAALNSDSLSFSMDGLALNTESMALDARADCDETKEKPLEKWNPKFDIDLSNALVDVDGLDESVIIPSVNMKYNENGLLVEDSRVILGNSDFSLKGEMTNLIEYFNNNELLRGDFRFTSDYTDVSELLGLFSGMGSTDTVAEQTTADTTLVEDDPFIVPLGTDITLHTLINRAKFSDVDVKNIGGDVTVKNGNLVLREVGFTTDAATMMLTAIYKSPRKNNLYAGFDFHLLDIDIAEMIKLVPDIDTIVPMLKSFAGNAEFHLAAETNLKADYSLKYSTLKAACSIEGSDLVVLDSETFKTIKKLLRFDKNTENKIDTLDVQFTLFRNEIDVYPFVVSLDKYQAALYGRHNLDMSYDYNISVLNPPILNLLGLEIKGPDFDNMKFKLRKGKVKNIFKPEKRNFVEEKIMDLKKTISESLKEDLQERY
ncbi:MAG: hypothetical protein MJ000_00870 [Bacteroidales bacterium]|nr:hypothetical protein [Bacteroidales bacterium]